MERAELVRIARTQHDSSAMALRACFGPSALA